MRPFLMPLLVGFGILGSLAKASQGPPADLARKAWLVSDAVLAQHVDPPARPQLFLGGFKAVYRVAVQAVPPGIAHRVSQVVTVDQLAAVLAAAWPSSAEKSPPEAVLVETFLDGMLADVPGGAVLLPPKEAAVNEQVAGNRYVGIHIATDVDHESKCVRVNLVMEGGPADQAGLKAGDLFEEVDGVDVRGKPLREVVERIRGPEGAEVALKLRRPSTKEVLEFRIVRRPLFQPTVTGVKRHGENDWQVRVEGPDAIGYLRISSILASTPRELHAMARRLEAEGVRALVLDLRSVGGDDAHVAVLLADALLEKGEIGKVRTAVPDPAAPFGLTWNERAYQAEPDALFRGWPMAVIVDGSTHGAAEWVAGALQDNRRADIVGEATAGLGVAKSMVPLEEGLGSLTLVTGLFVRGGKHLQAGETVAGRPEFPGELAGRRFSTLRTPRTVVKPDRPVSTLALRRNARSIGGRDSELPDFTADLAFSTALGVLRFELGKEP